MTLTTVREVAAIVMPLEHFIHSRHPATFLHQRAVGSLTRLYAVTVGLTAIDTLLYELAGYVHDVGKISFLDIILSMNGSVIEPDDYRLEILRKHTLVGGFYFDSLASTMPMGHCSAISFLRDGAISHHEKYNGAGYPFGLAGESIPAIGRVIAVADAIDSMSAIGRTWRRPASRDEIITEITAHSGTQFDPKMVEVFTSII